MLKSVDSKERTTRVRWLKPVDCLEDALKFDGEEVLSVYELAEHPDYNYFIGDIVIFLSPVSETTEMPDIVNQLDGLDMDEQHEHLEQFSEHIDLQTTADNYCDLTDLKNAFEPKEILCQQNEGSLSIPHAAFGFVARIASGLLQFHGSTRETKCQSLHMEKHNGIIGIYRY